MYRLLFFLFLNTYSLFVHAQSSSEIINAHIKAIGGESNWEKIKTMHVTASVVNEDGSKMNIQKRILRNLALRVDYEIQNRNLSKDNEKYYITIFGDAGWKYLPDNANKQILTLFAPEIKLYKEEFDIEDPFLWHVERKIELNMIGVEFINKVEYFKFVATYPSGKKILCYLNANTYMLERMLLLESDVDNKKIFEQFEMLKEGICIPKRMILNGSVQQITNIQLNEPMAESIFTPSKKNTFSR
jgi:hypothetical protein